MLFCPLPIAIISIALKGVSKQKYENTYGIKQVKDGVRVSSILMCTYLLLFVHSNYIALLLLIVFSLPISSVVCAIFANQFSLIL